MQDWLSRSVSSSRRNCQSWIWEPVLNSTWGEEAAEEGERNGREGGEIEGGGEMREGGRGEERGEIGGREGGEIGRRGS